tara:strand:- start:856 stop:1266 length:411 start_codon:yes stop_codon:yes gene_type:complete
MSNDLTQRQRMLLGIQEYRPEVFKVVNGTLYYRYKYGMWKGHTRYYQDYWYPVLTKKGKHWIGYNYSPKPCFATYLLHKPNHENWRYEKLKWVELGRGIGGRGLSRLWDGQWQERSIWTKMINPTVDMLIKPTDDE